MKSLAIIDALTLTKGNVIYGHFAKVSQQFCEILSKDFDTKIVGGRTYQNYVAREKLDLLPFQVHYNEYHKASPLRKLIGRVKLTVNFRAAICKKYDYFIIQEGSQNLLCLFFLMFKRKQSKIFLIKYNIETKPVRRKIHRIIKNKVSCVFTSLPQVGEFYEFPYLLIPDYFPVEQYRNLVNHTTKFDFVILGTIDNDKNIEDVIQSILNTEYTLKIAGHFHDKAYLAKIITMSGRSENILIQDKYLSDSEYKDTILQSKYVLLPYKKSAYLIRSSGVILDAVYKGVPVIATDIESFQFISKFGIGYLYDNSFLEILLHINEISYNKLIDNISNFRKMQENKKNELINKIHNLNS